MTFEELDKQLGDHAPFVLSLSEGEDNELTVKLAASQVGEPFAVSEDEEPNPALRELLNSSRPILPDEERAYAITFRDYIIYQVGNESYCSGDPRDRYSGRFLRVCESSALLKRLGEFSDAQISDDGTFYPGKWTHYRIAAQNHIIDVISVRDPIVNISIST